MLLCWVALWMRGWQLYTLLTRLFRKAEHINERTIRSCIGDSPPTRGFFVAPWPRGHASFLEGVYPLHESEEQIKNTFMCSVTNETPSTIRRKKWLISTRIKATQVVQLLKSVPCGPQLGASSQAYFRFWSKCQSETRHIHVLCRSKAYRVRTQSVSNNCCLSVWKGIICLLYIPRVPL